MFIGFLSVFDGVLDIGGGGEGWVCGWLVLFLFGDIVLGCRFWGFRYMCFRLVLIVCFWSFYFLLFGCKFCWVIWFYGFFERVVMWLEEIVVGL